MDTRYTTEVIFQGLLPVDNWYARTRVFEAYEPHDPEDVVRFIVSSKRLIRLAQKARPGDRIIVGYEDTSYDTDVVDMSIPSLEPRALLERVQSLEGLVAQQSRALEALAEKFSLVSKHVENINFQEMLRSLEPDSAAEEKQAVATQYEVDRHAEKQNRSYADAWRYFERLGYDMSEVDPQYS